MKFAEAYLRQRFKQPLVSRGEFNARLGRELNLGKVELSSIARELERDGLIERKPHKDVIVLKRRDWFG